MSDSDAAPKEPKECRDPLSRFTLKDRDTFLLTDSTGDIHSRDEGFFSNDTRILSSLELCVADRRPSLLGAAVSQDSTLFTAHLTNRPLPALGERSIPYGVIHLERARFLWSGRLYERLTLTNFSDYTANFPITLRFGADFADIFEVQGHSRTERGTRLPVAVGHDRVRLAYRGRDAVVRSTQIRISPAPQSMSEHQAALTAHLRAREQVEVFIEIGVEDPAPASRERHEAARKRSSTSMQQRLKQGASVTTSMRLFNQWIEKSRADLALLTTDLPTGPYPYAGIPWFATTFGRDAIITALQTLWINPQLAAGVLRFLGSTPAHLVHDLARLRVAVR